MKLYLGDCLEVMKEIPSNSVDLVVTDPPYLIAYKTGHRKDKSHPFCSEIQGDRDRELISNSIKELYRILKEDSAMYIFCSWKSVEYFKAQVIEAGFSIKNLIVWVKNNWTAGDLQAGFGQQYELILLCNKGRKCFNGKRLTDVWHFDRVSGKKQVHQNEKPVDLLMQCIEKHSNEGDTVLDAFMGVGSTGVACKMLNRNFIGIEIEEGYFKVAKERLGV